MAKQLNINMNFTSDTSQVQKNLQELYNSLNKISSIKPAFGMSLNKDMQSAVSSAKQLQTHLNNAMDAKTGNLNLDKLNASLKDSGESLSGLSANLIKAGSNGEQAFMNLQRSISTANVKLQQANGLLANFWTTLKNTARWQLSSSMLHGFMGAVQSAYGYAQDLNESLNNIRIVTGYGVDTMGAFAEQANRAAKALHTTTTAYTDAALIFYQQGLSGDEVTQRTDAVIKMANVTGESASAVSDYMTAVWNNFSDGSKSLEYYADVMTALGAATASSTDEIAAGLEKFAAIADTVGLSYEYATSALATVTAETRQSADVVGTAFKTIFARIQDLELGDTLEDGTTLGSYSEALAKVGISIKDSSGGLKEMNTILDEMGAKWETLNKDQQVALAQSVAGVRQYTQLIALMEDWDVMQSNVNIAMNAEGSLQDQQDIYAESWAAASKKVKASLEGLYQDLIPDEFIIDLTNGFADIISAVDALLNAFGGLPNILLLISNIALTKLGPSLTTTINDGFGKITNFINNNNNVSSFFSNLFGGFKSATTGSQQFIEKLNIIDSSLKNVKQNTAFFNENFAGNNKSLDEAQGMNASVIAKAKKETINLSESFKGYLNDTSKVYNIQGLIEQNSKRLTAAEKEKLSLMQQQTLQAAEQKALAQANLETAELHLDRLRNSIDDNVYSSKGYYESGSKGEMQSGVTNAYGAEVAGVMSSMDTGIADTNNRMHTLLTDCAEFVSVLMEAEVQVNSINGNLAITSTETAGIGNAARESANLYGNIVDINKDISKVIKTQGVDYKDQVKKIEQIVDAAEANQKITPKVAKGYRDILKGVTSTSDLMKKMPPILAKTEGEAKQVAKAFGNSKTFLDNVKTGVLQVSDAEQIMVEEELRFNQELEKTINYLSQAGTKASSLGGMITTGLQGFTTIAMGINSVSNAIETLGDDSIGFGQKLMSLAMALSMGFNAAKTAISGIGGAISILSAKKQGLVAANTLLQASEMKNALATQLSTTASELAAGASEKEAAAGLAEWLQTNLNIEADTASAMATQFAAAAKEGNAVAAGKAMVSNIGLAASEYAVLWPLLLIVAAIAAVVAGFAIWDSVTVSQAEKNERLAEASEHMKTAASEAASEVTELKNAFDSYTEVLTTLQSCVVGTTEWKNAMADVKTEIDEVLDKFPEIKELADYLVWDEKTQSYILNPDAVEDFINDKEDASAIADFAADASTQENIDEHSKELVNELYGGTGKSQTEMEGLTVAIASTYASEYAKLYGTDGTDGTLADTFDQDQDGRATPKEGDILWKFEQIMGDVKWANNTVRGNDAERKFYYEKEGGGEDYYTPEMIANVVAAYEATKGEPGKQAQDKATSLYDGLGIAPQSRGDQAAAMLTSLPMDILKGFATGDIVELEASLGDILSSLTSSEFSSFMYRMQDSEGFTSEDASHVLGLSPDQLNGIIDATLSNILGVDAESIPSSMKNAFQSMLMNLITDVGMKMNDSNNANSELLSNITDSTATMKQKKEFATEKEKVGQHLDGKVGANSLDNIEVDNSEDIQNLTDFYKGLQEISLSSEDAGKQIRELANEYNLSGEGINNFINEVDGLEKTFDISADAIEAEATTLNEIIGEGLDLGSIISEEDIGKIEDAGIDTSQYFTKMADGTYKLTSSADEFNKAVKRISLENLLDQVNDFKQALNQVGTGTDLDNYVRNTNVVQQGDDYIDNKGKSQTLTHEDADTLGKTRLDYIDSFEAGTFEFDDKQIALLANYKSNPELILTSDQLKTIAEMMEIVNQKSMELETQLFTTASSLAELDEIAGSLESYSYNAYAEGLINLASEYENCSKEVEKYEKALLSADEATMKAAEDSLRAAVVIGEASEKYDLEAEVVEAQASRLAKAYGISAEEAAKLAVKNQRMNKGIKSLTDNWEDWKKELNRTDKLTTDYADAVVDVTAAIADLVGACDDLELPDEFFDDENMKLIEKAANGDVEAINKLGAAVAETTVEALEFNQAFADLAVSTWELENLEVDPKISSDWATQFETDKDTVLAGIQQIKSGAMNSGDAMNAEWVAALNRMALSTGMSVEEMNGLLGSLGVQAKVETTYVKQPMEVPTYEEHWETTKFDPGEKDEKGEWIRPPSFSRKKYTVPGAPYKVDGYVPVAQISTTDNPLTLDVDSSIESPTAPPASSAASYSGHRGSVSPSSTEKDDSGSDSGSDSEPEEIDKTDKDDIVERYKEINDALDDMSRAYDRVSKAADRAYGKNRISLLKQANGLLQQEIDLLKIKQAEAQTNFDQDQANLAAAASAAGLSFDFDPETGNILNYTDQMNGLYARLAAAEAGADPSNFSTKEEQDEYITNYIEPLEKLIEELETAYGKYEETKELRQDLQEEFESKFYEWQDNNAEILTYTLELKLEVEDRELEKIEYMLSKIEDDFFSLAEAAALMTGYSEETGEMVGGQYASYVQNLKSYEEQISSLKEALDNEQISEEAYAEGLQTIYEGIYENLGNINELDKAMMNYYGDTISAAQEELSKYTDQLEHHNSVLSHYKSLMEIMGKSTDHQKMGTILKGQAEVAKNSMDVAQKNAEMYAGEAAKKLEAYETAMKNKNYEAAELYKKEYEAALAAAQEAEEEYLQSAEDYAQSLRDILENELAGFAQDLENALTGGTSFDQLNDKLSRAKSLQEEYLTTTNKIYETNKLMNTAQMEIDKTTNSVAKNRLKQFIAETNQLQEKNKLSQFELEIQQAKYDLLLAEIALEEAQNAKSTVRLSRDSEGNFGYVYTADDSKIAEAEQKLADEQNRLYNISLEGANNYTEKYQQTLNEMYDTLTELQQQYLEGAFESEQEYNDAVTAAKEYYYEKLEQYSSLHAVALTTDSRVIEEAWSSEFSSMVYSTDKWKRNVETYVGQVKTAFKSWETQMKNLEKRLGLDKIEDAVKKVTDESAKLTEELTKTDGVIDSLQAEFDAVSLVTGAWAEQRDVVLELIGYYEDLADTVQTTLDTMALGDDDDDGGENDPPANNPPTNNPPTNNPPSNGGGGDGKLAVGDMVTYDSGYYYYDSAGTKPLGNRGVGEGKKAKITRIVSGAAYPIHLYSTDNAYGWVKKDQISGFDSGGYTGDWGSDGKLAVLHEKELVLNKDDTENLLRTIELLRQTYDKDNTSVDSSAIFDLLRTSHNDLTALYEEELLSLNKEMHEIASESILKSNDGYTALIASCEDSLNNLNKDMGLSLSIMEKTYSEMQRSCDAEFGKMRNNMSAELNNNTKTYDKMVSEYSGQMLSLNKEMYSQFEKYQKEHEQIISSYESSLNEVASQALKTISLIGQGSYGKGFGGISLEEKQSSLKDEKFSQDMEIMNEAIRNIDLQKISAQIGGLLSSPSLLHAGKEEVLKQQVEISASFPNVTDHNELEEAFNNLINQASQYASKKKKNS